MTRDDEPARGTDPREAGPHTAAAVDAVDTVEAAVLARAAAGGYAMVGPSARTWSVNTDTGIPVGPVGPAEHRLVRDLIAQERLDGAEPVWLPCTDGSQEIVAAVVMGPAADADDLDCGDAEDRDEHPPDQTLPANDAATADAVIGMPAEMLDGIETRRTGPAERDDPAALQARLDDLRARIAAAVGEPAGGWRTVSARAAAQQLARRGTDPAAARAMVGDYLRETSERAGAPAWEWGLDQGDIDAIASAHDLPAAAIRAVAEHEDTQTVRAAQLSHWHTDGESDGTDASEVRGDSDASAGGGFGDEAGWSR